MAHRSELFTDPTHSLCLKHYLSFEVLKSTKAIITVSLSLPLLHYLSLTGRGGCLYMVAKQ
jgi:hypothetical protein